MTPSTRYENWLQLVRGEATIAQAATAAAVDRSTIIRVRQGVKEGALAALAASKPDQVLRNLVESEVASGDAFKGPPPRGCDVSPAPLPIK